jgi:hypothetical protein
VYKTQLVFELRILLLIGKEERNKEREKVRKRERKERASCHVSTA